VGRRAGDGATAGIGEASFGRAQERRRGLCWRVDIMKNDQRQGASSNDPRERVFSGFIDEGAQSDARFNKRSVT